MRARIKQAAAVVALGLTAAGPTGAHAAHSTAPNDDRLWIAQAGNGHGDNLPAIGGFAVRTLLFDVSRFPISGVQRPGSTRYMAFGILREVAPDGEPAARVAVARSENGIDWTSPEPATIKVQQCDQNNQCSGEGTTEVPFLVDEVDGFFAVTFAGGEFVVYYRVRGSAGDSASSFHRAVSRDGQNWTTDAELSGNLVTGQVGDFNAFSLGPTQVIFRPDAFGSNCATSDPDGDGPLMPSPWNCRWVLLYHTTDGLGQHFLAMAASSSITNFCQSVAGECTVVPQKLLAPGPAGSWDDAAATIGSVRILRDDTVPGGRLFDLYYAGARGGEDCVGGKMLCFSLGTATSSDGLTFVKHAANPVTPRALLEKVFNPDDRMEDRGTLLFPTIVDDSGTSGDTHRRLFYTRITNGTATATPPIDPRSDVFLAFTEPPPTQEPRIRIAQPIGPFRHQPGTQVEIYLTDTLGSSAQTTGIDLTTVETLIDGTPFTGNRRIEINHLVSALTRPAVKVTVPSGSLSLDDGPHVFEARVKDLDGNLGVASSSFTIDTTPPTTTLKAVPSGTRLTGCPLPSTSTFGCHIGSVGRFDGETIDGDEVEGSRITRVEVFVTNPLGQERHFVVRDTVVEAVTPKHWKWSWVTPTPDPFFMLPGPYTFSFLGSDSAAREDAGSENTVEILVL